MSVDKTANKKRIAVFFGGRSPEHDVSIVTGLQVLGALDPARYVAFGVYVSPQGQWFVGNALHKRESYMLSADTLRSLSRVVLDCTPAAGVGRLLTQPRGFFSRSEVIEFDVALLAFHGGVGESGSVQGLLEVAEVAYTGARVMASSIYMDKVVTKQMMTVLGIPTLPYALIPRPAQGYAISPAELSVMIAPLNFPLILKPVHMGSSIGIAKVMNLEELAACLPRVFMWDDLAMVEPFVPNLVEYNVAVRTHAGSHVASAIERPKSQKEMLDFKEKYLSGTAHKLGLKNNTTRSEGMLSLTRDINPKLPPVTQENIRSWAIRIFEAMGAAGAPRIDFLGNSQSGEIWMNEVNPIPGSFGYFLWEAAEDPVLFGELLDDLIAEAMMMRRRVLLPKDPVPAEARLFERKG